MHARKTARDAYFPSSFDDAFFSSRGDVVFRESGDARRFTDRINANDRRQGDDLLRPAEVAAMALVHEIFHEVIGIYRKRDGAAFDKLLDRLALALGSLGSLDTFARAFLGQFPPPAIYRHLATGGASGESAGALLEREGRRAHDELTEEAILLWVTNQNPAYDPVRSIVSDTDLGAELGESYRALIGEATRFFAAEPPFGPNGETLVELLLAPGRAERSILDQLDYIERSWGRALGLDQLGIWRRVLWARDFLHEEGKYYHRAGRGPGPGSPLLDAMTFGRPDEEPKRFSPDLDWMPHVVLMAKTVFVWLDQLSKKYRRPIQRLDQIPDEELDLLASRGFTGLWLIGLFERSRASRRIKQLRGDQDAVASAYSLMKYDIAAELGGHGAYENLKQRAWRRGLRLAADMVPNHVGIDAEWVIRHPDWFLQASRPPFPGYRFGGPDLSDDPRVGVFIEEGYWNNSDAAVVFRRHDRYTGDDRFIYHGNDGTSMPWNDTAQLDYTKAEVRRAVIETILHVARMFPIIRFDAAMTLAKRHFSRLWFPLPGSGGAIPSRSDYAMTQDEFDRVFPVEFWREVVDTVKERAPDTLLLAEAFWMMEGYFVRTLGMHRVYNSAFMNMLKREENEKYRQTIKNVLEFDPEVLKRFVNFMNNPDEETAVAQFGGDDKYFGVATLMCTMPGLPMFGHGQIEGFHEKYGMEYRRAKWNEPTNEGLVARHEREIFPLLKKRYLFSGVSNFALYDFMAAGGGVDEDVYAYTNAAGHERALVLYNNKYKDTRGRIDWSVPARRDDGSMASRRVADALGLSTASGKGDWILFRDAPSGLEYVKPMAEIAGGFAWALRAFEYRVLHEFRVVQATAEKPYDQLAAELAGRGVPSLERALVELRFRPLHAPLREAVASGHVSYLLGAWDAKAKEPSEDGVAALEERLGYVADGLAYMKGSAPVPESTASALSKVRERYRRVLQTIHAGPTDPHAIHYATRHTAERADAPEESEAPEAPGAPEAPAFSAEGAGQLLMAWAQLDAVLDVLAALEAIEPPASRAALVETWQLALPLVAGLGGGWEGERRAALVLLAALLPAVPVREALEAALHDARGRVFLGVHEANGTMWLGKEAFDDLARLLALRGAMDGRASIAMARREAEDACKLAEREGYRAFAISRALGDDVKLAAPAAKAPEGARSTPSS